ncbi:hypothetical protein JVT61DRAFT_11976 [Boletus reticuloceps]|uniref:Uncharacterized protein n=1 Tax=Boletus reticuloceps TaxID=495285 RepID=A0A8I2YEC5_9AGAM|nr:hypothetical protein JVT61DRAFT_11976 [Boletus reticuloceps]
MHVDGQATLLYPLKMFYPGVLPLVSMFDAFFRDGRAARRSLRVAIRHLYLIGDLRQNHQHLHLGTLPGMDILPPHWLVGFLPFCTQQCDRLPRVWWK